MLSALFDGKSEIVYDDAECVNTDRDGRMFEHVLCFLSRRKLLLPQKFDDFELLESEADFIQIQPPIDVLNKRKQEENKVVSLNVGGVIYTKSRSTLCRYPDSMLGAMFGDEFNVVYDQTGCVFIDRDGHLFQYILNFLRHGQLILPEKMDYLLRAEADFYQIKPMIDLF